MVQCRCHCHTWHELVELRRLCVCVVRMMLVLVERMLLVLMLVWMWELLVTLGVGARGVVHDSHAVVARNSAVRQRELAVVVPTAAVSMCVAAPWRRRTGMLQRPVAVPQPAHAPRHLLAVLLRVRLRLAHRARADHLGDGFPRPLWVRLHGFQEPVVLGFGPRPGRFDRFAVRVELLLVERLGHADRAVFHNEQVFAVELELEIVVVVVVLAAVPAVVVVATPLAVRALVCASVWRALLLLLGVAAAVVVSRVLLVEIAAFVGGHTALHGV